MTCQKKILKKTKKVHSALLAQHPKSKDTPSPSIKSLVKPLSTPDPHLTLSHPNALNNSTSKTPQDPHNFAGLGTQQGQPSHPIDIQMHEPHIHQIFHYS
eukprot:GHVP01029062.1.p1 GENE.GHVP01029062.1~~GHVP01029062.1.p1  ORF type:complete len:100 (-),score=13.33 GHVP01029062.1:565-864(-)